MIAAAGCGDNGPGSPATIEIDPASATIATFDTVRFRAVVRDRGGRDVPEAHVVWSSTVDSLVIIDHTGLATGRATAAAGQTNIVATVSPSVQKTALVTAQPCILNCGTWEMMPGMPTPRRNSAFATVNSVMYIAGGAVGFSGSPGASGSTTNEAFDAAAGAWTLKAPMPDARRYPKPAVVGGIIYVLGGGADFPFAPTTRVVAYDPSTNSWSDRAPMPTSRTGILVAVVNGIIYVLGTDSPSVDAYDPAANTWTARSPMLATRSLYTTVVLDGKLYAIFASGGAPPGGVDAYDPATNTWSSRAPMPAPRAGAFFLAANGRLYAIAGTTFGASRGVDVYDPATNAWSTGASVPIDEDSVVPFAVSLNGLIYVGRQGARTLYVYHPALNAWSVRSPMSFGQYPYLYASGITAVIGGRLYLVMYYDGLSSAVLAFTP